MRIPGDRKSVEQVKNSFIFTKISYIYILTPLESLMILVKIIDKGLNPYNSNFLTG